MTICPVSWGYHEAPIDCWRMYPAGLRALYEHAGLKVLHAVAESLDKPPTLQRHGWFLLKQGLKALAGREPFLQPLEPQLRPVVDTVVVGQKPNA
jgi:hypothetical protein